MALYKIVLAEDEPAAARIIRERLESFGYEVWMTDNGEETFTLCRKHQPDLIISDIIMPLMNGEDFLISLKRDPSLRDVPFVVITAKVDVEKKYLELGADAFLEKPFSKPTNPPTLVGGWIGSPDKPYVRIRARDSEKARMQFTI